MSKRKIFDEFGMGEPADEFHDMSELVDADIDRVDLVGKAANGHQFILAKSGETSLFPSAMVREFLEEARRVTKKQSNKLGTEMETEVQKADEVDLDVTEVEAEPTLEVKGDAEVPGTPAWEAIDAATAAKWSGILARAKNAVCQMIEREEEEIEAGHEKDKDGKENLEEALEAIEYAISMIAPFAVNEAAEAAIADEDFTGIEKAVKKLRHVVLSTVESFAPLAKAGTLSEETTAVYEGAVDSIMKAVENLPKPESETLVEAEKEEAEGETPEADETPADEAVEGAPAVAKSRVEEIIDMAIAEDYIAKAEGDAVAVDGSDAPASIDSLSSEELARIVITGSESERKEALMELGLRSLIPADEAHSPDEEMAETTEHEAGETPEEEAAEAQEDSTVPAPADEVGVPADAQEAPAEEPAPAEEAPAAEAPAAEAPAEEPAPEKTSPKVKKSKKTDKQVMKARDEESDKYIAIIKSLEERIASLEAPAPSRVLTNGALPPAHLMRGQDAGKSPVGDAEALRKASEAAPDAVTKAAIDEQRRIAALEALSQVANRNY